MDLSDTDFICWLSWSTVTSWRGSIGYFSLLTQSIYSTILTSILWPIFDAIFFTTMQICHTFCCSNFSLHILQLKFCPQFSHLILLLIFLNQSNVTACLSLNEACLIKKRCQLVWIIPVKIRFVCWQVSSFKLAMTWNFSCNIHQGKI